MHDSASLRYWLHGIRNRIRPRKVETVSTEWNIGPVLFFDQKVKDHEDALATALLRANLPDTFSMRRAADAGYKLRKSEEKP